MQITPEISFRNVEPSERTRDRILEEIGKLERYFDGIIRCRVVVEMPHRRHESGNLYHVGLRVTVPSRELVVTRDPPEHQAHEELDVAVTDAFQAMRRQLEEYSREIRGEVKSHEVPPHGRVSKLFPEEDYGFILTPDVREVYFHRNSLVDAEFDDLEPGTRVWFEEEQGVEGPQASTVHLLGKRNLPPVGPTR